MVTITPIPVSAPSSSVQQLLVQLTEGLCLAYSTSSMIKPSYSVNFTVGEATVQADAGTTTYSAIVPIYVSGSITYLPKGNCTCRPVTKLFSEQLTVGFTGLTASPTTFTVTTGMLTSGPANVKSCNRAYGYNINTAITITAA